MRNRIGWTIAGLAVLGAIVWMLNPGRDSAWTKDDAATGATPAPYERESFAAIEADQSILVHCGNSMRPAAEAIAARFQRETGIAVQFNFGGSAELLASIELGGRGDLYICHDPYADLLDAKALLDDVVTVGALTPVMIVPPDNPRSITSVRDLAATGLRLGMPDARYATASRLVRDALGGQAFGSAVERNISMESRGHNDVALALMAGHIDAGIVWNFIATFYQGRMQLIDLDLDIPPTRVTVCLLAGAADPEAARRWMQMAADDEGRRVFERFGYLVGSGEAE